MEWGRVKTILIIVLLAVNVFLFAAYANSALRETRNDAQVHEEVCRVVTNLGYRLDADILPEDSEVYYPARISRSAQGERQTMESALGSVESETSIGVTVYTGKKGSVTLRSGGHIEGEIDVREPADAQSAIRSAQSVLRSLRLSVTGMTAAESGGGYTVEGICSAAETPIYNCRVTCVLEGGRMTVSGRVPVGEISYLQNVTPRAVSGLMLNFAQHVQSAGVTGGTIRSIRPGYVLNSHAEYESGTVELVPVWRVTLDSSDWYVNALTGEMETPE